MSWAWMAVGVAVVTTGYAYLGYPLILWITAVVRGWGRHVHTMGGWSASIEWPVVTVMLPVFNEERVVAQTLDTILALDYPKDRLHVLVVSDASSDRTDEIVRGYANQGVDLIRLPRRSGKSAAENEARKQLRGELVVNTDASVRLHPLALKRLVAAFDDPTVGIASGRDVSVAIAGERVNVAESEYVRYEMWVRDLETLLGGIVGASGCFYASRIPLQLEIVPEAQSRDFAAPLIAREHGFRSVSIAEAVCYVPRTPSIRNEYRRKVRTMTRGLETLFFMRTLLNPVRHGFFAWKLISHKLVRWLVPLAFVMGTAGLVALATEFAWARFGLGGLVALVAAGLLGWWWPSDARMPRVIGLPAYVLLGLVAGLHAWIKAVGGDLDPIWEPTRREPVHAPIERPAKATDR